jgi:hypothetical protein
MMKGWHIDKQGEVLILRDSSGQVGGLGRADGDVGRLAFTMLLIALCAYSMPGIGGFGVIF